VHAREQGSGAGPSKIPVLFCILASGILLAAACRKANTPDRRQAIAAIPVESFRGENALEEAGRIVACGPRAAGTAGAGQAARHIAARLEALGLSPQVDEFQDGTPDGRLTFRNVQAFVGRKGAPLVVLLSHYDTPASQPPAFLGANDSGSSSGVLLEIARILHAHPPEHIEVLFAFLDGEEARAGYAPNDGLHGSRRLANALAARPAGREDAARPNAVILLDMVGDRDMTITIPRNSSPSLTTLALACARAEGIREKFGLYAGEILDDHVPFLEHGYPALDLIDFEYGSAPGRNDYWHTPADTMDKLSAESLQHMGRVVMRMLNALPLQPPAR
jgi:glutaminyl-peptide cyclotransferase